MTPSDMALKELTYIENRAMRLGANIMAVSRSIEQMDDRELAIIARGLANEAYEIESNIESVGFGLRGSRPTQSCLRGQTDDTNRQSQDQAHA